MKPYIPASDHNLGNTLHGLTIKLPDAVRLEKGPGGKQVEVARWEQLRSLCWKDYRTPYWDASIFQDLLYQDEGIKADLAKLAEMNWSAAGHRKLRQTIVKVFTDKYPHADVRNRMADYTEAKRHLVEHAQVVADWCMYEYSHYPYEWGVAYIPADIEQYIPADLWADDITRAAKRIQRKHEAGDEVDLDRVRKGEYDYEQTTATREATPATIPAREIREPVRRGSGQTSISRHQSAEQRSQELLAKEVAAVEAQRLERVRQEQEQVDKLEAQQLDRELERRLQLIDEYATDATLDQTDDKPIDGLVLQVPLAASELRQKLARQIDKANLRRKEKGVVGEHRSRRKRFKATESTIKPEEAQGQANV